MSYFVIVRGPLGVGKTTVARRLASDLGARYISIDRILDDEDLWEQGRLSEFLAANETAARSARRSLTRGVPVIIDGNFYWKAQLDDLAARLGSRPIVFTLRAPLRVCIARDSHRDPPHGSRAARAVYRKAAKVDRGTKIDATGPVRSIVAAIKLELRKEHRVADSLSESGHDPALEPGGRRGGAAGNRSG